MRIAIAGLVALLVCGVDARAQRNAPAPYFVAIDKYAAGDVDGALALLKAVPRDQIQKQVESLVAAVAKMPDPRMASVTVNRDTLKRLEAAAMLHIESAVRPSLSDPHAVAFDVDMSHALLSEDLMLIQRLHPGASIGMTAAEMVWAAHAREFMPRWYRVSTYALLLNGLYVMAERNITEAARPALFPSDIGIMYWQAVVTELESQWVPPAVHDPNPQMSSSFRDADQSAFDLSYVRRVWQPAEDAYRRVLAADPSHHEARLHLGYVLLQLHREAEARSELEQVRDHAVEPYVLYLSHLFLARVAEAQSDLEAAAQHYERAIAASPAHQTAYIGLSLVEIQRGRRPHAQALVQQLIGLPKRIDLDPWWQYRTSRLPPPDWVWLQRAVIQ